jgi:hypothetical protein
VFLILTPQKDEGVQLQILSLISKLMSDAGNRQEILIAGGRTVNLRDAQSLIFLAGASALMVGNYLTTLNQPVEKDLQMLKDLGLDPSWDKHGFSDQEEIPMHRDYGKTGCEEEVVAV